jgi:hypothetical protein
MDNRAKTNKIIKSTDMGIPTVGNERRPANLQDNHQQLKESIGPYDILCGRHKAAFNNIGNRRFRITVKLQLDRYLRAPTRLDKSLVIQSIIHLVSNNNGGRFLKWDKRSKDWVELDDKEARAKVGHAIRDMVTAAGGPSEATFEGGHQRQDPSEHVVEDDVSVSILSALPLSALSISEVALASVHCPNNNFPILERRQEAEGTLLSEYGGAANFWTANKVDDFDETLFSELDDLTTEEEVMVVNTFKSDETDISDVTMSAYHWFMN